jgi:hypothetical protein
VPAVPGAHGRDHACLRVKDSEEEDQAAAPPLTQLKIVRCKSIPFPPEPFRWAGIQVAWRALARSDRREGRREACLGLRTASA